MTMNKQVFLAAVLALGGTACARPMAGVVGQSHPNEYTPTRPRARQPIVAAPEVAPEGDADADGQPSGDGLDGDGQPDDELNEIPTDEMQFYDGPTVE